MKAFKCDRCNTLYEPTKGQGRCNRYNITNNPFVNGCLDLCDKCFNELQEWMAVYSDVAAESEVNDLKEKEIIRKGEKRVKKHCVYFEGHIEFSSDSEDEEKILDEAYDLMFGNIPDIDVTIANMAIDDEEDAESEDENDI